MSDNRERDESFEPKYVEVFLIRDLCIAQLTSNNDRHPVFRNRVSIIIRRYTCRSNEVCCFYGCLVYHILSYSFGSIF